MNIVTLPYQEHITTIPEKGNHILAQQTDEEILVYQAFNEPISDYAIKNQKFGGDHYSFSRMSWIKPNFLWMMYRSGWSKKVKQERILGIWLKKHDFVKILGEAVYSSYQEDIYPNSEYWKSELEKTNVQLQWDPYHDIYGRRQERRALQLGLRGEMLNTFNEKMIVEIQDLTDFVRAQKDLLDKGEIEELRIPEETVFLTNNDELDRRLKISAET